MCALYTPYTMDSARQPLPQPVVLSSLPLPADVAATTSFPLYYSPESATSAPIAPSAPFISASSTTTPVRPHVDITKREEVQHPLERREEDTGNTWSGAIQTMAQEWRREEVGIDADDTIHHRVREESRNRPDKREEKEEGKDICAGFRSHAAVSGGDPTSHLTDRHTPRFIPPCVDPEERECRWNVPLFLRPRSHFLSRPQTDPRPSAQQTSDAVAISSLHYHPLGTTERFEHDERWRQAQKMAQQWKAAEAERRHCRFQPHICSFPSSRSSMASPPSPPKSSSFVFSPFPATAVAPPTTSDATRSATPPTRSVFQRLVQAGKERDARLALARFHYQQHHAQRAAPPSSPQGMTNHVSTVEDSVISRVQGEQEPPALRRRSRSRLQNKERRTTRGCSTAPSPFASDMHPPDERNEEEEEEKEPDGGVVRSWSSPYSFSYAASFSSPSSSSLRSSTTMAAFPARTNTMEGGMVDRSPSCPFTPTINATSARLAAERRGRCGNVSVEDRLLFYGARQEEKQRQARWKAEEDGVSPPLPLHSIGPYAFFPEDHVARPRERATARTPPKATPLSPSCPPWSFSMPRPSTSEAADSPPQTSGTPIASARSPFHQRAACDIWEPTKEEDHKGGTAFFIRSEQMEKRAKDEGGLRGVSYSGPPSSFVRRQAEFLAQKKAHLRDAAHKAASAAMAECTFSPHVTPYSSLLDTHRLEKQHFLSAITSFSSSSSFSSTSPPSLSDTPDAVRRSAGVLPSHGGHPPKKHIASNRTFHAARTPSGTGSGRPSTADPSRSGVSGEGGVSEGLTPSTSLYESAWDASRLSLRSPRPLVSRWATDSARRTRLQGMSGRKGGSPLSFRPLPFTAATVGDGVVVRPHPSAQSGRTSHSVFSSSSSSSCAAAEETEHKRNGKGRRTKAWRTHRHAASMSIASPSPRDGHTEKQHSPPLPTSRERRNASFVGDEEMSGAEWPVTARLGSPPPTASFHPTQTWRRRRRRSGSSSSPCVTKSASWQGSGVKQESPRGGTSFFCPPEDSPREWSSREGGKVDRHALLYEAALAKRRREAQQIAKAMQGDDYDSEKEEDDEGAAQKGKKSHRRRTAVNSHIPTINPSSRMWMHASPHYKALFSQSFLRRQELYQCLHTEESRRLREVVHAYETRGRTRPKKRKDAAHASRTTASPWQENDEEGDDEEEMTDTTGKAPPTPALDGVEGHSRGREAEKRSMPHVHTPKEKKTTTTSPARMDPRWEECRFHPQLSPASLAVLQRMKGREKDVVKRLTTVTVRRRSPRWPTGSNEETVERKACADHIPHSNAEEEGEGQAKEETEQHASASTPAPRRHRVVTVEAMEAFYQRQMARLQHKAFRIEEEKRRASFQALLECTFRPQTTPFPPRAAVSPEGGRGLPVSAAASPLADAAASSAGVDTSRRTRATQGVVPTATSSGPAWTARDGPGVEQFLERQALAKRQKEEREERWRKLGAGMPLNGPHHTICTPFHLETQVRRRKSGSRSSHWRSATPSPRVVSPPYPTLRV